MNEQSARRLQPAVREYMLRVSNVYTSLRQASEWGMRGLQGSFPHCKKCLPSNFRVRRLVIESIVLIHNFCTNIVGSNQIKPVFDPEYERFITLDGYDHISNYNLQQEDFEPNIDGDENDIQ